MNIEKTLAEANKRIEDSLSKLNLSTEQLTGMQEIFFEIQKASILEGIALSNTAVQSSIERAIEMIKKTMGDDVMGMTDYATGAVELSRDTATSALEDLNTRIAYASFADSRKA